MTLRVCPQPGCGTLTTGGPCSDHAKAADRARGPRQARGYDRAHDAERRRWQAELAIRPIQCARCGQPINPGEPFDLGHTDDRTGWTGPEHPRCNRAAGGRAAHGDHGAGADPDPGG